MSRRITLCTTAVLLLVGATLVPAQAEKTVLRLRVDGPLTESPSDMSGLFALMQHTQIQTLRDWVTTVQAAGKDPAIDGLVLVIESPAISLSQLEEMTAALKGFRAQHKPIYAFLDYGTNLSYALAAQADHVTLAENSELWITGLHTEATFYKRLLDKIGVEFQVIRSGAYKSALEPFVREDPSPEFAEMLNWLLDSLYQRWLGLMADGRGLTVAQIEDAVNNSPLTAEDAQARKLIDDIGTWDSFRTLIHKEFGSDVDVRTEYREGQGDEVDFQDPFAVFRFFSSLLEEAAEPTDPGIGLVYLEGAIMVGESDDDPFGGRTAGSTSIRGALEKARTDDRVKVVVFRVDSPGGSAIASDIIWQAAHRLAQEKPLIVSMGSVAGSGGYYVAVPGDTIFAEAATITGSIGVIAGKPVWHDLMADKLGITSTEFSRGAHAGLMSLDRPWNEQEQTLLEGYIDHTYKQFKDRVRSCRGERIKKNLDDIAGGRVYTGEQALKLGLVDKLGGLEDALALARQKADLPADARIYVIPKPSDLAALVDMLDKLGGGKKQDNFPLSSATAQTGWLQAALPLLQQVAPDRSRQITQMLRNLALLTQEHAGCFMTFVPHVR